MKNRTDNLTNTGTIKITRTHKTNSDSAKQDKADPTYGGLLKDTSHMGQFLAKLRRAG